MSERDEYLFKYLETFGEGFPMYQLGRGATDEEIVRMIKRCLKAKKDVYALGILKDDEDIEY